MYIWVSWNQERLRRSFYNEKNDKRRRGTSFGQLLSDLTSLCSKCTLAKKTHQNKRSPRDPTKKRVSLDTSGRRGSSADSASTFVTARIQRVSKLEQRMAFFIFRFAYFEPPIF